MMIDIAKLASRPTAFDGDASAWPDWSFKLRAYLVALDADVLDVAKRAEGTTEEIMLSNVGPDRMASCRALYTVLAMSLEGSALALAKSVEEGNGAELWRRLKEKYEPAAATRTMALLQRITAPAFTAHRITEELQEWENVIQDYERCSGMLFQDDMKMAILAQHCPDAALKGMLMMSTAPTYARQKEIVQNFARSSAASSAPTPMDVCAVARGGKSDRKCYSCGKPGHFARDCKGGGKGARRPVCQLCDKEGHTAKACPGQQPAGASQIEMIF